MAQAIKKGGCLALGAETQAFRSTGFHELLTIFDEKGGQVLWL